MSNTNVDKQKLIKCILNNNLLCFANYITKMRPFTSDFYKSNQNMAPSQGCRQLVNNNISNISFNQNNHK